MLNDLRFALRSLRNSPGFTLVAVLTLALGIGANATVFDVVDRLLFRPPPLVHHPDRVVRLYGTFTGPGGGGVNEVTTYGVYRNLSEGTHGFSSLAAFHETDVSVGRGVKAEKAHAALVSSSYFPLLGIAPAVGRAFAAEDDRLGADPTVVLGYGYWQRRFGGDPHVLGRRLWIGHEAYAVIGVAPKGFTGVDLDRVDLWLPLVRANALVFGEDVLGDPRQWYGSYWLQLIGRLAEGVSPEAAAAQTTPIFARAVATAEERLPPQSRVTSAVVTLGPIQAARGPTPDRAAKVSTWLGAVALFVLLIACANAANLLLTRALSGQHDVAVRLALGSGRWALMRHFLAETGLLALAAAGVAMLCAAWFGPLLRAFLLPTLPSSGALSLRVFGATAIATLAAGALAGLVPAWQGSRVDLVATLKSEARAGARRSRLRMGLLAIQVALTVVLLAGAGLFIRSLRNVRALDLGLDTQHVLMGTMDLAAAGRSPQEINQLYLTMVDRIAHLPGVERVAAATAGPFGGAMAVLPVRVPGGDSLPKAKGGAVYDSQVTPGYFEATGTGIVRGRGFTPADDATGVKVAVIDQSMARLYFPGENPVGKCLDLGKPQCVEIVGVAKDAVQFSAVENHYLHLYVPPGQWDLGPITGLFVKVKGNPAAMIGPIRRTMQALAPDLPYANVTPLGDRVDRTVRPWRLGATLFSVFGALALVVAALGLYGILSHAVTRRTREIGLRMALGADEATVLRLVVREGLLTTCLGLAVGLAGAYAAGRAVAALLYGVSPSDATTLAGVSVLLLAVALCASYLPARRAAHVDPMEALRYE